MRHFLSRDGIPLPVLAYPDYRLNDSENRHLISYQRGDLRAVSTAFGHVEGPRWFNDTVVSNGREKSHDKRQQSIAGMSSIVESLSDAGELICDPFAGSRTTAIAALSLGRRFIGCDVDPAAVRVAKHRLSENWLADHS